MITWGISGCGDSRRATVFCNHCRAVFAQDVALGEVMAAKAKAETAHHCTPPKPWRPGQTQ